jgi:hypothetical protein
VWLQVLGESYVPVDNMVENDEIAVLVAAAESATRPDYNRKSCCKRKRSPSPCYAKKRKSIPESDVGHVNTPDNSKTTQEPSLKVQLETDEDLLKEIDRLLVNPDSIDVDDGFLNMLLHDNQDPDMAFSAATI